VITYEKQGPGESSRGEASLLDDLLFALFRRFGEFPGNNTDFVLISRVA
jgi:hypothetical protein